MHPRFLGVFFLLCAFVLDPTKKPATAPAPPPPPPPGPRSSEVLHLTELVMLAHQYGRLSCDVPSPGAQAAVRVLLRALVRANLVRCCTQMFEEGAAETWLWLGNMLFSSSFFNKLFLAYWGLVGNPTTELLKINVGIQPLNCQSLRLCSSSNINQGDVLRPARGIGR